MATSSFKKDLVLTKEAAIEFLEILEKGTKVNKIKDLKIERVKNPEILKEIFGELKK